MKERADKFELMVSDHWSLPIGDPDVLHSSILVCASYYGEQEMQKTQRFILEFYAKIWHLKGRPPYLYEVYEAAYSYNNEIYQQIALIDMASEYDADLLSQEEIDEKISEKVSDLEEMYSQYDCAYLDYFAANVLDKFNMIYLSDADDFLFEQINAEIMADKMTDLDKDSKILVNDCQNVMFKAFLENDFTTSSGDLVYHRQETKALTAF